MTSITSSRLQTEIERQQQYLSSLPSEFTFPLFNAKTALESQRRSGYHSTAAAAREIVDNAIEAGASGSAPAAQPEQEQILRGRMMVVTRGCPDCHGGMYPSSDEPWLAGRAGDGDAFPADEDGQYRTWARNLTPDVTTGMGRFSERQIFNALRFGCGPAKRRMSRSRRPHRGKEISRRTRSTSRRRCRGRSSDTWRMRTCGRSRLT